ncbi:sel1 repeat family protein [Geminocystis sp. NIES-3708]|uniref:sel1 repeat family protein n=1 Tax=Geminocystis sp. NIES-3708 TaxID=1615909 RepID=UPI0008362810|nr:sel1 repeat family protein [Geminocystis sp. NIES-3708]
MKRKISILKPLAEEGNQELQCILSNIYHLGLGVNHNIQQAIKWCQKSPKQGYLIAENNLKTIYLIEKIDKEVLAGNF